MKSLHPWIGCIAATLLVCALPAQATVVRSASLRELATASTVIVHAVVRNVNAHVSQNAKGPFLTEVSLEIIEGIKGIKKDRGILHLTLPGGTAGDRTLRIPGMPVFSQHDEVVLLLEANAQGTLFPIGMAQGVFYVDRSSMPIRVTRNAHDVLILPHAPPAIEKEKQSQLPTATTNKAVLNQFQPAPATLDELLKVLRSYAVGSDAGGAP